MISIIIFRTLNCIYPYNKIWFKYVSKFYGFEEKPDLDPSVWLKARLGNKVATDEVVERCEADVRITAQIISKSLDLNLIRNIGRYP